MRIATRTKSRVNLDSIALADVVINLFLFFFITFSLAATFNAPPESKIKVTLPAVQAGPASKAEAGHQILLTSKGYVLWDKTPVSLAILKKKLQDEKIQREQVTLRSDRDASVQSLVRILETVRDAGATNVALQTELIRDRK